jgi:hypothetical protein
MIQFILLLYAFGLLITGNPAVIPTRKSGARSAMLSNNWFRLAGGSFILLIFIPPLGALDYLLYLVPGSAYFAGLRQIFTTPTY